LYKNAPPAEKKKKDRKPILLYSDLSRNRSTNTLAVEILKKDIIPSP
jgi:hypothetical protein